MTRSKRLRKKLYVDEFAVYGFSFEFKQRAVNDIDLSIERADMFWEDFIDARHLTGITTSGIEDGYEVTKGVADGYDRYQSATQADREFLIDYLLNRKDVIEFAVGPLWDVWNGNDDNWRNDSNTVKSDNYGLA